MSDQMSMTHADDGTDSGHREHEHPEPYVRLELVNPRIGARIRSALAAALMDEG